MNLYELLRQAPAPDAIALVDRAQSPPARVSYADLAARALRVAAGLAAHGIRARQRVGILADNRGEYYDVVFGAAAAGAAVVPLNTRLPADQQAYIAADADLRLVISDTANRDRAPAGVPLIEFDTPAWGALAGAAPLAEPVAVADDDVAVHIYTSGSTGRPKGVLLSHRNICWTCLNYGVAMPGEVMLVSAPLYHKNASMASKLCFVNGGTVVLLPRFSAAGYIDAIEAERVTMCSGVPTMYALVTAEIAASGRKPDFSSVRTVLIGSAPLTEALFDDVAQLFPAGARITNGYGTTEAVLEFSGAHPRGKPRPKIALGYRHPDVELRLVDPATGADGDHGELWVRSPGVMVGYHGLPEVNAARLTGGWYHTGDLMHRDADGWYFFVGRVDDMFVCAGENIYPDAVEQLLERHPAVHQAVVVPVPDALKGALPAAFIRIEPGHALGEDEVKRWALEHGPAYAHPRRVWFVEEIPLASTNKIDRAGLIRRAEELAQHA
jgi:acyl-CoA synthetase (AMP-forming)/AMP-acid ligase II